MFASDASFSSSPLGNAPGCTYKVCKCKSHRVRENGKKTLSGRVVNDKRLFMLTLLRTLPTSKCFYCFKFKAKIQGSCSQHFILFINYEWAWWAWVFICGRPFRPSLIFASDASFSSSTLGNAPGCTYKVCKSKRHWVRENGEKDIFGMGRKQ